MSFIIIALLTIFADPTSAGRGGNRYLTNVTHTLDTLLANNRYDKRLRPGFGGAPLIVSVNLAIKSMGPVSENDQSFGLDCYFRQHWYDWRLRYQKLPGLEEFSMSWLFLDKVWKPDTYFINSKKSFLHRITVPNKFLRLRYDGYITYSMRLTITASCPMYLRKFPLDAQRCPLIIGSYGYTNKDLVYEWSQGKAVGLEPGVEIAQFDILNVTTESEKTMLRGDLSFSTVQANFWLKRHTGYFMLQVYVPCGLIVLSSWVSFWIDPHDVAARVALGVTTVLSLTTMGFGSRAQLPKVSYWTALDWFVILCFTSVFSVMIEYAVVNFIDKFTKDLKKIIEKRRKLEEEECAARKRQEQGDFLQPEENLRRTRSASNLSKTSAESPRRRKSVAIGSRRDEETFEGSLRPVFHVPQISKGLRAVKDATRRLSATVSDYIHVQDLQNRLTRSIRDLTGRDSVREETKGEPLPKVIVTDEDDLIDFEAEPTEVVVDVESEAEKDSDSEKADDWEDVDEKKQRKRFALPRMLQRLKNPKQLWEDIKILPRENDIIDLLDDPDAAEKFSKIDIQARKNFPILFFISLTIYLYAFSYYLSDDFPERDANLLLYKQR
ncbi:UNVERIFIED_CONTAM: hypothetical protein PYX00_010766 [Menopon gallinae]|uniref:Gamma-aminobutyric acid receptor subunit beta n=1 Tax=Menopon gallinae TaxID=328185 RepID=A0AAW2HH60_9NEOP